MLQVKFDLGYFCFNLGQNEIPLPSHNLIIRVRRQRTFILT